MTRRRRVHGENAGTYSLGPNSLVLPPRQESGKFAKQHPNLQRLPLAAQIDALMRALVEERHEPALGHLATLIELEPDEPRWHERCGDVLRLLDRAHEAATAYRTAAFRYDAQALSDHGSELRQLADQLEATAPDRSDS